MIPSTTALANFHPAAGGGGGGARVAISNKTVSNAPGAATYQLNSNGNILDQTGSNIGTWLLSGVNSDYDVRATLQSGTAPTGSGTGSWLTLGLSRSWTESATAGNLLTCTLLIEIRDAVTLTVLDSATVNITSDST